MLRLLGVDYIRESFVVEPLQDSFELAFATHRQVRGATSSQKVEEEITLSCTLFTYPRLHSSMLLIYIVATF